MEGNIIQILVQGGLTSITLVTLYVLYRISANQLLHSDKTNERFAQAIDKLSDAITALKEKL